MYPSLCFSFDKLLSLVHVALLLLCGVCCAVHVPVDEVTVASKHPSDCSLRRECGVYILFCSCYVIILCLITYQVVWHDNALK